MLKLRPYKKCDAELIASWVQNEKEFYQWSAGRLGDYPFTKEAQETYSASVEENDAVYQMVAYDEEGVCGYLIMRYLDEERLNLRFGFIIVAPDRRGRGTGRGMLKLALTYAFDILQVKRVSLGVFENNEKAYRCYLGMGFSESSPVKEQIYEFLGEKWKCIELETTSPEGRQLKRDIVDSEQAVDALIGSNGFRYVFQPIVSATTGEIFGYEALMRSDYEQSISPKEILNFATKHNRLYEIEKATFQNVLALIEKKSEELADKKIFINSIPGYQLNDEDYEALKNTYGKYLTECVVEMTEANDLTGSDFEVLLERSKKDGFKLAIDDYGTGYSNTNKILMHLPHCVKIDRLLITNIHEDTKRQHFVKSMVDFGHQNGFLVLAEGVETQAELRAVIQIGVDLIQGFYTARPSFDLLKEIEPQIRNEIINANVRGQTQQTMNVYVVKEEKELPLMLVALQQNTGILISQPEFTLVGNPDYVASMSVKIKDDTTCRLVLRDVLLESFQDMPCIELGKNVDLTLVLEGENRISKVGICVPDTSRLTVEGNGSLQLKVQGIQSYGIGNQWETGVGDIRYQADGKLDIQVEADYGIGIGGGIFKGNEGITITSGRINIEGASAHMIGVGAVSGDVPIRIRECSLRFNLKIDRGIGIGCMKGLQDIEIESCNLGMIGSGSVVSGIGGIYRSGGTVSITFCEFSATMNGQKIFILGVPEGELRIQTRDSILELLGEGTEVLGIGSRDLTGTINMKRTNCNIVIRSGGQMIYGAREENICLDGGLQRYRIND